MKIAFVHNFATHYTVGTFEILARRWNIHFYFYSKGKEWYWLQEHGVKSGNFHFEYLPGIRFGRTRVTPTLIPRLLRGRYDLIIKDINGRFVLPLTYCIARITRRPFILWTGVWMRIQTPFHKFFFPIVRHIYRHSDAVVVYGLHVKDYLLTEGVEPDNIFVEHHAVDNRYYNRTVSEDEKANLLINLEIASHETVVLYLGRLEEIKGLDFLIRAFALADQQDAVLVIAGTGSQREQLECLAKRCRIAQKVRFAGYVDSFKTAPYYAIARVFVLPSVTTKNGKELWGLSINEAFNQGVPVIATESVGAAAGGLVIDGFNGIVVPERDIESLANGIRKMLLDNVLHDALSRKALESIRDWTQDRMADGFGQAIEYVLDKRGHRVHDERDE